MSGSLLPDQLLLHSQVKSGPGPSNAPNSDSMNDQGSKSEAFPTVGTAGRVADNPKGPEIPLSGPLPKFMPVTPGVNTVRPPFWGVRQASLERRREMEAKGPLNPRHAPSAKLPSIAIKKNPTLPTTQDRVEPDISDSVESIPEPEASQHSVSGEEASVAVNKKWSLPAIQKLVELDISDSDGHIPEPESSQTSASAKEASIAVNKEWTLPATKELVEPNLVDLTESIIEPESSQPSASATGRSSALNKRLNLSERARKDTLDHEPDQTYGPLTPEPGPSATVEKAGRFADNPPSGPVRKSMRGSSVVKARELQKKLSTRRAAAERRLEMAKAKKGLLNPTPSAKEASVTVNEKRTALVVQERVEPALPNSEESIPELDSSHPRKTMLDQDSRLYLMNLKPEQLNVFMGNVSDQMNRLPAEMQATFNRKDLFQFGLMNCDEPSFKHFREYIAEDWVDMLEAQFGIGKKDFPMLIRKPKHE